MDPGMMDTTRIFDSTMVPPDSMTFDSTGAPIGAPTGGGGGGSLGNSIWYESTTAAAWPLIRYLMDDSVYHAQYASIMRELISGPLAVSAFQAKVDHYGALVTPYIGVANTTFNTELATLRDFMTSRLDSIQIQLP